MADVIDIYEQLRHDISEHVASLEPQELAVAVPATPNWTIQDVVAHPAADASYAIRPRSFPFAHVALMTDAAVHQQDIFGAWGSNRGATASR